MRKMVKNINLYEADYQMLKDLKLVPSESYNDVLNRLLDMIERGEPINYPYEYDFAKKNIKSIKISVETYRRWRLWKKPEESFPSSIHNLLTNSMKIIDAPSTLYEVHYQDFVVMFKVVDDTVYYLNTVNEKWENESSAWICPENAVVVKDMITFMSSFLLKPSAMVLLDGMGDELVYGEYSIVKCK